MKKAKTMSKKTTKFTAVIEFKDGHNDTIDVSIDTSEIDGAELGLTYDDVEFAVMSAVDARYGYSPDDDSQEYSIEEIRVECDDGMWPVVCETDRERREKFHADHTEAKMLVLPEACYALTPEFMLYSDLLESGAISKDVSFEEVRDALSKSIAVLLQNERADNA